MARGDLVALNASGSTDPDGDPLTYAWTQVSGPDVTGGIGRFVGATPTFVAPPEVSTLFFDLTVNDGHGESPADSIQINVFEPTGFKIFVDRNSGSDEVGDGSREMPYASIVYAVGSINGPNQDIHVMALEGDDAYTETRTISLPVTTSLYGGYGPGWVRDVANTKTRVLGAPIAIRIGPVNEEAWVSGFDVSAADATESGQDSVTLLADSGSTTLYIEHNMLAAGSAGAGTKEGIQAGTSYGIIVSGVSDVEIRHNAVTAGSGGAGATGSAGTGGADAKSDGGNGSGATGGSGGTGAVAGIGGGAGGKGGVGLIPVNGSPGGMGGGANGGNGGIGDKVGAGRVGDGSGGRRSRGRRRKRRLRHGSAERFGVVRRITGRAWRSR